MPPGEAQQATSAGTRSPLFPPPAALPDPAGERSIRMGGPNDSGTRVTLLGRLRPDPGDQRAWAEFVEHYGRRVYGWCRRWGLQEADAQDVTQNVLLRLAGKMKEFSYDPARSFRAWLKTVTQHSWSDYV